MLTYHRTSLLDSQAQTVVNTVNTVGVMGKGLAAAMRKEHPKMFQSYKRICDQGLLDIGKLWLWQADAQWVLNFPTKKHWRHPSKLAYIEAGLEKFVATYEEKGIREIAFPRLGCGNGGLDWEVVRPLMERYLSELPIRVYIHDYAVELKYPEHKEYSPEFIENSFHDFLCDLSHVVESLWSVPHEDGLSARLYYADDQSVLEINARGDLYKIDEFELSEFWNLLSKGPVDRARCFGALRAGFDDFVLILAGLSYLRPIEISKNGVDGLLAVERVRSRFPIATVAA